MNQEGFWIFMCPKCGKWGSRQIKNTLRGKRFNCHYCGKSSGILKKNSPGLQLNCFEDKPFQNNSFVASKIMELNMIENDKM